MINPLIALSKLANYPVIFGEAARTCGFGSSGEIDRFLFKCYGKAVKDIPPASRPKGAVFLIGPPSVTDALANLADLRSALEQIRADVSSRFYKMAVDLVGGLQVYGDTTAELRRTMAADGWPPSFAARLSTESKACVLWANGVSAHVYLDGMCYIETPDVVEELAIGLPSDFQRLSWDDGAIVYECAKHKLNDTTPAGIWEVPEIGILRPKPEKLMSIALGEFLRLRMAGYKHHDDEPYVDNQGRADVSLHSCDGSVYIIEVKWVGRSLKATQQNRTKAEIEAEAKKRATTWLTQYGDEAVEQGAKQLAIYFGTSKYQKGYLVVFDCDLSKAGRKSEYLAVDTTHVKPYNPAHFRLLRVCVDPRKASKVSKAKHQP